MTNLDTTNERLEETSNILDSTRRGLETTQGRVQQISETQEMAHRTIRNLKAELSEVGATADAVNRGLRETNSLVLPNLHMEGVPMSAGTPTRGSEKDRHIKKVSKFGGTNRMAWI